MIRTVLFDLDGTLYDRDALMRYTAAAQYHAFRELLARVGEPLFTQRLIELDDHGYSDKREVYTTLAEEWDLADGLDERLLAHFWEHYDRHCHLPDDVASTLNTLRSHGRTLGVITNGVVKRQIPTLEVLGLGSFFDTVLVSQAEGIRKPDPAIFLRALERCRARAEETVFVGDHPDVDVAGAIGAGIAPIWKRVPYWRMSFDGVMVVDELSEILPFCLDHTI